MSAEDECRSRRALWAKKVVLDVGTLLRIWPSAPTPPPLVPVEGSHPPQCAAHTRTIPMNLRTVYLEACPTLFGPFWRNSFNVLNCEICSSVIRRTGMVWSSQLITFPNSSVAPGAGACECFAPGGSGAILLEPSARTDRCWSIGTQSNVCGPST